MALSAGRQWIAVHGLRSGRAGAQGIILGPNLFLTPNGPYTSGNWATLNTTETTGQTDPLGGTSASLLTDTVTNAQHLVNQGVSLVNGQKYLFTSHVKPGTYPGSLFMTVFNGSAVGAVNWNTSTHVATNSGSNTLPAPNQPTNISAVAEGNGFWRVSWNFVSNFSGTWTCYSGFNVDGAAYAGTLQNYTLWGMSIQTST